MVDRRSLIEGLSTPLPEQKVAEKKFVFGEKAIEASDSLDRKQLSTRIRPDLFKALKRASLERQLEGQQPHNVQDILEACLEPWLKQHGFLR